MILTEFKDMFKAACTVAAISGSTATTSFAQQAETASSFGCVGLEHVGELPSIEGLDGVFYRINTDLRMNHPFSEQTVSQIAELSDRLAENGTTLVYVPVPTKSISMPDYLPDEARLYGFDLEVATEVHLDILQRLEAVGVVAVDAREAILGTPDGELPFFRADFHWSAAGARETAKAVAEVIRHLPEYEGLEKTEFESLPSGLEIAFSGMRRTLQEHCLDTLPEAETIAYQTIVAQDQALDGGDLDLFGADESANPLTLVGTSFSDSSINNFAGFIAEYSELEVANFALTGGNQFGAITSYLTSEEFETSPPRFLVWENPIYNNLAQYGDHPMRELIAAASRNCTAPLAVQNDAGGEGISVDLTDYDLTPDDTLLLDTNDLASRSARFVFLSPTGLERTKIIERAERVTLTGRFYMPLSGLWDGGPTAVRIEFDNPSQNTPSVFLCPNQSKDET